MWTPRRLVLLACGFMFFVSLHVGYALSYLGGIDGLPPLPEKFCPTPGRPTEIGPLTIRHNTLDQKIKLAFGEGCPELVRPIRLEMHNKGMVLAADQFQIEQDGRVCLTPLSVGLFGKPKLNQKTPEINTLRSQVAYLTFDRPVSNLGEIRNGQAAYAATDLPESIGAHWRMFENATDEAIVEHYHHWFYSERPDMDGTLIMDPAPIWRT